MPSRWFTVIDVMRAQGIATDPATSWAIGAAVRDEYLEMAGELPPKHLRQKTSGAGSHCFALYPPDHLPMVQAIVARFKDWQDRQLRLPL